MKGADLLSQSGCYVLLLHNKKQQILSVGKLGDIKFSQGYYAYIGSAFGPGGIKARVGRHLRLSHNKHWHIDYIKTAMEVEEVWLIYTDEHIEHQCAQLCSELKGAQVAWPGFGSSDCSCASHLYFYAAKPSFRSFTRRFKKEKITAHVQCLINSL